MAEAYSQEIENLKRDLSQLRGDVSRLLDALADSGKSAAESAKDDALSRLRTAASAIGGAARGGCEAAASVERQVTEHPFLAAIATFGVGYLFGRLVSRR